MSEPPFDLAIVHHRTPELLAEALRCAAEHAPAARVSVLDTAPSEAARQHIRAAHLEARYRATVNHSYAHAVNVALREAHFERVMVLNADVRFDAHAVRALHTALEPSDVAAAGPTCRTPSGAVQDQGLPYRWATFRARGAGADGSVDAPWLSGCLLLLKRDAAGALGGFDTRLRFANEDLEWCLRARRHGWRCRLTRAEVIHVGGSSTPDDARFVVEGVRGGMAVARRHHRPWRRGLQRVAVRWGYEAAARWGPRARRPAYRAAAAAFARGAFDGGPFGPTLSDLDAAYAASLGPAGAALTAPGRTRADD